MFVPPPFRYFAEVGWGYVDIAALAVWVAKDSLKRALMKIDQANSEGETPADETLADLYSYWTKTDEILLKLSYMSAEEREKHIELGAQATEEKVAHDLDEVREDHAEVTAAIEKLEKEQGQFWLDMLDESLINSLERFQGFLVPHKERGVEYEDEGIGHSDYMESVEDLCSYRDGLEYARIGIGVLRASGRLKGLKRYDEYVERLKTTDELFKYVLRERRGHRFSTDPTFWWHKHHDAPEQDAMFINPPKRRNPNR
jgi:hypothetical protein